MVEAAGAQVSEAVLAALIPAARYAALVVQRDPDMPRSHLLNRSDVTATLTDALAQAQESVSVLVRQGWGDVPEGAMLGYLLADVARQYGDLGAVRREIRDAHSAAEPPARVAAVRRAVIGWARKAAVRSRMTTEFARTAADAVRVLERGRDQLAAGEPVRKRWMARRDSCYWCRSLHGVTVSLDGSFVSHLAGPADLSGHGRLTQPPKVYHGILDHPPLHPHCRCRLVVVTQVPPESPDEPPAPAGPVLVASEIRAMPEEKYRGLAAFLRAAVLELGQVLRRLAQVP